MKDKQVQPVKDIAALLSELSELICQSKNVLCRKKITRDQGQEMAKHVTGIRLLITELCEAESSLTMNKNLKHAIKQAKESCLDLEGMVKEIRNSSVDG